MTDMIERRAFENLPNDSMLTEPTEEERAMHAAAVAADALHGDDDLYDEDEGSFI